MIERDIVVIGIGPVGLTERRSESQRRILWRGSDFASDRELPDAVPHIFNQDQRSGFKVGGALSKHC